MEIKGKKAVIVGGASGMARASAELLHEQGASVAILDLPTSAGAEVAKALGGTFHPVDVTDDDSVEAGARPTRSRRSAGCTSRSTPPAAASAKRTLTQGRPAPARRVPPRRSS